MAFLSGNVKTANSAFLLLVLPIMLRLWVEAVLWRLESGPQMIFFSLMHGGAGLFTPFLIASLLAVYFYFLWVFVVAIRWLIPRFRSTVRGVPFAAGGGVAVFAFFETATILQQGLAGIVLYAGVIFISVLGLVVFFLIAVGLLGGKRASAAA